MPEPDMTAAISRHGAVAVGACLTAGIHGQAHEGSYVSVREVARLLHFDCADNAMVSRKVFARRQTRDGEPLIRAGDAFHSLYIVRAGCFKTVHTDFSGSEQVLGFLMSGELMGADGIDTGYYNSSAISIDIGEVVVVPFAILARLADECPALEASLYRVMSHELVRVQNMVWTLGTLGAESRVAAFLLSWSAKLGALGYSCRAFNLRMTRQEIGSYLGLSMETVSRAFSALHNADIIHVSQRSIEIVDVDALRSELDPTTAIEASRSPRLASNRIRIVTDDDRHARNAPLPIGLAGRQLASA
jgi:CRP/FNR family transcriptional regulator